MKRRLALLALPLLLAAFVFGVKWRADHPTPTQEDLTIRALMMEAQQKGFEYFPEKAKQYNTSLTGTEMNSLLGNFYLLPKPYKQQMWLKRSSGFVRTDLRFSKSRADGLIAIITIVNIDDNRGQVVFITRYSREQRNLHPVTVRRWINLLLANPRIGPELRARLK